MKAVGYTKASTLEVANVAVLYRYSLGAGRTVVTSQPDFVWGGQSVQSSTSYPRVFEIMLVDIERSKLPEKIEVIWQGEVNSSGYTRDMSRMAKIFIGERGFVPLT